MAAVLWGSAGSAADLRFEAPAECERAEYVLEQVEALIGGPLDGVNHLKFEIRVRREEGASWRLELVTVAVPEARSSREFVDHTCTAVLDAAAVAVAMAVQNAHDESQAGAREEPSLPSSTAPPTPDPLLPPARERPSPARGQRVGTFVPFLNAGIVGHTALLPDPSWGASVGLGVRRGSLVLGVSGTLVPASTSELAGGRQADFEFLGGAALACFVPAPGTFSVLACGGYELGRLSGQARQVSEPHLGSVFWHAARLEIRGELSLTSRLSLSAGAGAAVPVTRSEFLLDGAPVHRTQSTLRGDLGMTAIW